MTLSNFIRLHWAALRALLVLTVITGLAYPLLVWVVAQFPGLRDHAEGSILTANGKPVGSRLIGQLFTDKDGNPLPQYFQSRPSAAGTGYDPTSSGGSNLGPESIVDAPGKPGLLTTVCSRSAAVAELEGVDGSRPFCTGGGVGAVLSVIGPRDERGNVTHPARVVSVNEPCESTPTPFVSLYEGVRVECAKTGEDYSLGQIVPIRGAAPAAPAVPADAVTAGGSGLDPNISPAYADIQVARVAKVRHVRPEQIRELVAQNSSGRALGFFGEPCVNVLQLNLQLDHRYPVTS
ncbi:MULTISPECIES: potassium-transporting ATPase subunit C [Mycobacterium avium complex (MAC)]|jgi:K+-transporting ATPase ATPase C chain|uniref:Potassium-transporting ATPase KdpC subunit n=9 Tax=Mycobacterium avium complex (MAC) TaxID=120793 RepID=A0ABX3TKE0_9MYCO|nr:MULTISPECIES: potassium-transporting ATPase subunit C [Mycobacterium avium complex (MAC)]ETA91660.1 K transporting ATPase KdpC subunit [Mycobacterium avium 05-4293]ETB07824.1 K transporting ATPase KdpC subunit [Mycobacterium avium subsp. silvaticum ATCC 49884]ETB15193.1 K transporting ATPase KdpC subunit [Mycobacterium avium subsp. avium 10-9275]ETB19634.1 K transporting ATPase KdpC subunit [Mycobacterium avium subsp. avium 11-4751]EUA39335.1 K+-transporting ATPase, C subunit [Mycobacterium